MQTPSARIALSVWIDPPISDLIELVRVPIAPLAEFHAQLEGFENAWQRVCTLQCPLKGG